METQTRLSRHNKFISAENITIFSISSDDYLHIYIITVLIVTKSLCGFVLNQVQYNMERLNI